MDVTMLRWPEEEGRRSRISLAGEPRLLLVPDGEEPPPVADCLEDWIRIPAAENEVRPGSTRWRSVARPTGPTTATLATTATATVSPAMAMATGTTATSRRH